MTLKESYEALGLKEGADLAEIKRAYRRLAFSLHPDLNPSIPDAAKRFQRVNEAYVLLSQHGQKSSSARGGGPDESTARAREEARKAYSKARQGQKEPPSGASQAGAEQEDSKESVLKDILNDPFARRVFEDIYSHIREEGRKNSAQGRDMSSGARGAGQQGQKSKTAAHSTKAAGKKPQTGTAGEAPDSGVVGKLKGWLRKQIDDEQVLRLPGASLVPGARVRLEIQHGFSGEPQVVELTLPPGFEPGKAMRLKGMGKRLGNWKGDLYVRIEPI